MALEYRRLPRDPGAPTDTVTVDRHWYLTEDKDRVVPEGNPAARWLWATPGMDVPRGDAERLGAVDAPPEDAPVTAPAAAEPVSVEDDAERGDGEPAAPAEETKTVPKPSDKQRAKPGDKKKTIPELRKQATELGVQVDNRWGEPRLRQEIAAAESKED